MAKISGSYNKTVKRPLVSFVIIAFADPMFLTRCVKSILSLNIKKSEIIIVKNNHALTIPLQITKRKFTTIISNTENVGVAKARNQGLKNATGKFIVFIDDDAFFKNNDLSKALDYLENHKNVGILAPKIYYPNGKLQESIRRFPNIMALFWRGSILERLFPNINLYRHYLYKDLNRKRLAEVDWGIGACLISKRDLITKVNGFNNTFFLGYDDADFCKRMKSKGYKTVYYPDLKVVHVYQRRSKKGLLTKEKLLHIKGIITFLLSR